MGNTKHEQYFQISVYVAQYNREGDRSRLCTFQLHGADV